MTATPGMLALAGLALGVLPSPQPHLSPSARLRRLHPTDSPTSTSVGGPGRRATADPATRSAHPTRLTQVICRGGVRVRGAATGRRPARQAAHKAPTAARRGSAWAPRDVGAAVVAAAAVVALMGTPGGLVVGTAAGGAAAWTCRRARVSSARRARLTARRSELPAVADLLSVCLVAGLPLDQALDVVATALPGAIAPDLRVVSGLLQLGASPDRAWQALRSDPVLGILARAASRSGDSGSTLALALEQRAAEARSDAVAAAEAAARRSGVLAMAPLGLCFLPAFVCLGVIPVVLGIAGQVFGAAN